MKLKYERMQMFSSVQFSSVQFSSVHFILPATSRQILKSSIFLEWMKLRSSNLANGSSMAGFTPGVKNFP